MKTRQDKLNVASGNKGASAIQLMLKIKNLKTNKSRLVEPLLTPVISKPPENQF